MGMRKTVDGEKRRKRRCKEFLEKNLAERAERGLGRKPQPPRKRSASAMGVEVWRLMDRRSRYHGVSLTD